MEKGGGEGLGLVCCGGRNSMPYAPWSLFANCPVGFSMFVVSWPSFVGENRWPQISSLSLVLFVQFVTRNLVPGSIRRSVSIYALISYQLLDR